MGTLDNIKHKYRTANVVEKLIALNLLVFVLQYLFRAVFFLFGLDDGFFNAFINLFSFPKDVEVFVFQPWSIVTYAFLHGGLWHIVGNMLILYYAGTYFLNYFSAKKLLNFYFLGAIVGGLIYMLSYNLFPAFKTTGNSYLVGASAGVMAILVGIATHIPNMRIRLMILGSIKFWWIAAFFVVMDIVQIPMSNSGGHLAHLGGALFGYVYALQLGKGNDIGEPFERLLDWIGRLFSNEKKPKMKTVHKKKPASRTYKTAREKDENQQKIDAILDKIGKSGYESLTKREKDFLFNAGKDK